MRGVSCHLLKDAIHTGFKQFYWFIGVPHNWNIHSSNLPLLIIEKCEKQKKPMPNLFLDPALTHWTPVLSYAIFQLLLWNILAQASVSIWGVTILVDFSLGWRWQLSLGRSLSLEENDKILDFFCFGRKPLEGSLMAFVDWEVVWNGQCWCFKGFCIDFGSFEETFFLTLSFPRHMHGDLEVSG